MWKRLANIDSRFIYCLLVLAIVLPFFLGLTLPVEVQPMTQNAYDVIESLDDGIRVLLSFDYSFSAVAECNPFVVAFLKHLATKDAKIYAVAKSLDGAMIARDVLPQTGKDLGKVAGVDYVNLGYFAGEEAGIATLVKDIRKMYSSDFDGESLDEIEIMDGVNSIEDFELVIAVSSGGLDAWIHQVSIPYGTKLIVAVPAGMVPRTMPFVQAKQITAMTGALRGGAEYEKLIDSVGGATLALNALASIQMLVLVLLFVGNLASWASRRHESETGGASVGN